jgi:SAM-dependent methyltransferase
MLLPACQRPGAGAGRTAVDLGCGGGTDALALLDVAGRSWPSTSNRPGLPCSGLGSQPLAARGIRLVCASFADVALPPAHLVHAGFSLPFCPPPQFPDVWEQIRRALAPGGIFAGQLFGTRDSWAGDPGMTFQDRSEVTRLLDGLEIVELHETERDGEAYSGPRHWHTYDILAREPAGHAHPAG